MVECIPINPEILKWARDTAGYSLEDECKKYPKYSSWESGDSFPTYAQLEKLANRYHRPVAIFFYPDSPREEPIEKSLRALSEEVLHTLSPNVHYLFRKAKTFQIYLKEIYSDEIEIQKEKIRWLDAAYSNSNNKAIEVRKDILNIPVQEQKKWMDSDYALEVWRDCLAKNGVYVFKEAFKDENVSGFCIYDDLFPVVFLNNSQHKNRQIFTLFHEVAHLTYRQTYLDVFDDNFWKLEFTEPSNIEVKCNEFAAEFLVPTQDFLDEVKGTNISNEDIKSLSKKYCVSKEVIIRKFLTLKLIDKNTYTKYIQDWKKEYRDKKQKKKGGGGNYYYTQLSYLGSEYFAKIISKYHQGYINLETASSYANIKPKNFNSLEDAFLRKEISNVRI